jgi:predicted amidophosphoribosyltransferase
VTDLLRRHAAAALDLVWPPVCPVCGGRARYPREQLCEPCWGSLRRVLTGDGEEAQGERVLAAFACDALLLRALATSKYRGFRRVGRRLAREAAGALAARVVAGTLVPVPLARAKRRERGFNQTEDFAAELARRTARPVRADWLRRVRGGRALAGLPHEARRVAVGRAFAASRGYPGPSADPVWLVDDVVTTGSTAAACAAALRAQGGCVLGVLAIGRAFAPSGDRPPAGDSALARL